MGHKDTDLVSVVNTKMVFALRNATPYRFGMNRLKELREEKELNQYQLADAMGVRQPEISRWEKQPNEPGYRRIPVTKAKKAARILGCLLIDLRPDLLEDKAASPPGKSVDSLLRNASQATRDDVYKYAKYRVEEEG